MKTLTESGFKANYKTVRDELRYFAINEIEGVYVSENLWKLPESWINGMAEFIKENRMKPTGWICSNLLHDLAGYINKNMGFSPRCFKGGNVWDQK